MPYRQPQEWKSWIESLNPQIPRILNLRFRLFQPLRRSKNQIFALLLAASLSLSILIPSCAKDSISPTISPAPQPQLTSQTRKPIELSVVSFAVTRAAYTEIIPLFKEKWKREHNQEVRFRHSFAGSSTQTRAVINGLPTDVVHLALALDTNRIQQ